MIVPSKLKATYDCFTTRMIGTSTVVERDVTYQAFWTDQFGTDHLLYGTQITEHLTLVSGRSKPPESSQSTSFVDTIGIGNNGVFQVNQTFTVAFNGVTYSNLPLYDAYGNPVAGNTNKISATASSVSVDGQTAAKNGNCN